MKSTATKIMSIILCLTMLLGIPITAQADVDFNLTATRNYDEIDLNWNSIYGVDRYVVFVSVNGGEFNYYWETRYNSISYCGETGALKFYVSAVVDEGECPRSNIVEIVSYESRSIECDVSSSVGTVELYWDDYSSATGYYIYKSTNGSQFALLADIPNTQIGGYRYNDYIGTEPAVYKYVVLTYQVINGTVYCDYDFSKYYDYTVYMEAPVLTTKTKSEKITWKGVAGAGSYTILARNYKIGTYKRLSEYVVATVPAGVTSYTATGVDNINYEYSYIVIAYDHFGNEISRTDVAGSNQGHARFRAAKKKKNITKIPVINSRVKKNKTAWNITLTAKDKKVLKAFAKKNFKPGMTDAEKAEYTLNWINKNVKYVYGKEFDKVSRMSYVQAIFVNKKGQCLQYNGAFAMFLAYLGYESRVIQGWRGTNNKNKISHYWCEMKVDGKWFLMETGNYGKNGYWSFFCEPYANTHYSNTRYLMNGKRM